MSTPTSFCLFNARMHPQRGFMLIEVLVTLFIIAVWLLGTAGIQLSAAKTSKAAQFRTDAVLLASEMAERIEANKATAATGAYACNSCSTTTVSTACVGAACSGAALAAFDLAEWGTRIAATLPGPTATI